MNTIFEQAKPIIILFAVCAALVTGILLLLNSMNGSTNATAVTNETLPEPQTVEQLSDYKVDIVNNMNPIAILNTNKGTIEIELFEHQMPITAGNFKKLVTEGFYDGVKFHRVIEGFMIQGGDPITKTDEVLRYGTGGPEYKIPDEHIKGSLLTNVRGTIAMANSGPNTGGSQFFINLKDNVNLDFDKVPLESQHPVFGRVVSGMDVVDAIAKVETSVNDLPLEDIVIETAKIKEE